MIFNGEKYACEACVRGHRVSNCNHSDRPLQHINKKGRPVTQCAHCRAQRKSRSSHVKCDCGEKTSKCAHLQKTVSGHTDTCCCNHGGKCSCCGKMEPSLDTVPETECDDDSLSKGLQGAARPKLANRRRRAATIHSDNMMSFDANGNRKPAKHNRASQQVGPYSLNRVNSAGAGVDSISEGRKSVDAQRRVKSEATSPLIPNPGFQMGGAIPPLDLSNIDYSYTNSGPPSAFDLFGAGFSPENDAPLYSAGLNNPQPVDWSHYDFPAQNDAFGPSSYSATGYSNFPDFASNSEYLPNLVNTTSNSGDVSEAGDWNPNVYSNGLDISSLDRESFYKDQDHDSTAMGQTSYFDQDAVFVSNYQDVQDGMVEENMNPVGNEAYWTMP